MDGYIYKCVFKNKIYIGESINALDPGYLGTGKKWLKLIAYHRKEVSKEILEKVSAENRKDLKKLMHEREIYWISYYDSTNPEKGYNISPGGNILTEESLQKMKENDSKTMKLKMQDPLLRKRISEGLKKQRREIGMSDEHRKHLSESLKGKKVGGSGDSRSIPIICKVNNTEYVFHSKREASKWYYENYPFSNVYSESSYVRAINAAILLHKSFIYNGKNVLNTKLKWKYLKIINKKDPIYCIYNNKTYYFDTKDEAAKWWHNTYPLSDEPYNRLRYICKITSSIKGQNITYNGWVFNKIKWYKKEKNL